MERTVYTLRKSFGWIEGREHKHIERGTKLTSGTDDALISTLHRRGAHIERTGTVADEPAPEQPPVPPAPPAEPEKTKVGKK